MTRNTIKQQVFTALDSGRPLTQIWHDLQEANPHRGYGWNYMTKLRREWRAERSSQRCWLWTLWAGFKKEER